VFTVYDFVKENQKENAVTEAANSFDVDDYLGSEESTYELPDYTQYSTTTTDDLVYEPENGKTYWYVYITKGNDWEGYTIIQIDAPYFSLVQAHKQIRKQWTSINKGDFIGIEFYKQVSEACYVEYMKPEDN